MQNHADNSSSKRLCQLDLHFSQMLVSFRCDLFACAADQSTVRCGITDRVIHDGTFCALWKCSFRNTHTPWKHVNQSPLHITHPLTLEFRYWTFTVWIYWTGYEQGIDTMKALLSVSAHCTPASKTCFNSLPSQYPPRGTTPKNKKHAFKRNHAKHFQYP